jgi:hypothetical protein
MLWGDENDDYYHSLKVSDCTVMAVEESRNGWKTTDSGVFQFERLSPFKFI